MSFLYFLFVLGAVLLADAAIAAREERRRARPNRRRTAGRLSAYALRLLVEKGHLGRAP